MTEIGHARETLALATRLLERADPETRSLWPRAAALLGRQALEDALAWVWAVHEPALSDCSSRAQLLCLATYLRDEEVAEEAAHVYATLSWACHHHPYDLAPTAGELRGWLSGVARVADAAAKAAMSLPVS